MKEEVTYFFFCTGSLSWLYLFAFLIMHTVQETIAVTTIPKTRAKRSCLGLGDEYFLDVVLTESRVALN